MPVDTLHAKLPPWPSASAADAATAVNCQCSLARNLSDFPFPAQCSDEELGSIQERVLSVLDSINLLARGQYYALPELSLRERRFLAERHLITYELMLGRGPRGVYVSEDQGFSIMVNGNDHVCLRVVAPALTLKEAWSRLNLTDDTLSGVLDFAFDKRLGYLTSRLDALGTGLKASVLLHLTALSLTNQIAGQATKAKEQRLTLHGVTTGGRTDKHPKRSKREDAPISDEQMLEMSGGQALYSDMNGIMRCDLKEAQGDLFLLVNQSTLGCSEEEITFLLGDMAMKIMAEEEEARNAFRKNSPFALEDRVGRAKGVAANARLLGFREGLALLSSLRLGVATGALDGVGIKEVNETLIESQGAHLEMSDGRSCDTIALSTKRADLFRARFNP